MRVYLSHETPISTLEEMSVSIGDGRPCRIRLETFDDLCIRGLIVRLVMLHTPFPTLVHGITPQHPHAGGYHSLRNDRSRSVTSWCLCSRWSDQLSSGKHPPFSNQRLVRPPRFLSSMVPCCPRPLSFWFMKRNMCPEEPCIACQSSTAGRAWPIARRRWHRPDQGVSRPLPTSGGKQARESRALVGQPKPLSCDWLPLHGAFCYWTAPSLPSVLPGGAPALADASPWPNFESSRSARSSACPVRGASSSLSVTAIAPRRLDFEQRLAGQHAPPFADVGFLPSSAVV